MIGELLSLFDRHRLIAYAEALGIIALIGGCVVAGLLLSEDAFMPFPERPDGQ